MIQNKIRRVNDHSLSYLSEVNRKDLVLKSLRQSPERVARSQNYSITGKIIVDVDNLLDKDQLVVTIPVNQYKCTIQFNNVIETIAKVADRQTKGNVNFDTVETALNKALDDEKNLLVNCTCPDFYYRFSYVASENGYYQPSKKQKIPAPIRNPRDDKGSFCKHLIMILKNKKWVRKLASVVNYLIKEYYLRILQVYDLDSSNFYINQSGKHSPVYGTRPMPGRSKLDKSKFIDDTDDDMDDEEELILKI